MDKKFFPLIEALEQHKTVSIGHKSPTGEEIIEQFFTDKSIFFNAKTKELSLICAVTNKEKNVNIDLITQYILTN
jgi:hypothetical protein